ncbi:MAG: lipopolysaccharide heptosyltransferase II, partial [Planctomycetota bacterium]
VAAHLCFQERLNRMQDSPQYKRILVRAPNWLGDVIMLTPCIRALRDAFPDAHVGVLVKKNFADVFRQNPAVNEIIPFDSDRGLRKIFALRRLVKKGGFDLAIVFPRSFRSALPVSLARVPRRIGYGTEGRGFLLTDAVPREKELLKTHRVNYYAHLLRPLGVEKVPDRTEIFPSEDDFSWADRFLANAGSAKETPLIALHCGAAYGTAKQWPHERFARLAGLLHKEYNARIIIVGGPGEKKPAEKIAADAGCDCKISAGKTTVLQLAALLKRCDLLVTNDTGPMHVADAAGTRILAVFGPTDPVTTAPYGRFHRIVTVNAGCAPCLLRECPTDHRCMTGVTVEMVLKETGRMLATKTERETKPE